jgi:hypothetical protein
MDDAFFELSPRFVPRSAKDIPSRKRAQYRRRYAMVDAIAQQIGDAIVQAPRVHAPAAAAESEAIRSRAH